jgi:hypothetical protein
MKISFHPIMTVLFLLSYSFLLADSVDSAAAQAFYNLDFEAAMPPNPASPGEIPFTSAFPGWSARIGGNPVSYAVYDTIALDTSVISLVDRLSPIIVGSVYQGNYTAILQAGLGPNTFFTADTTLSQTGLVPPGTVFLSFEATLAYGRPPTTFAVTLGGAGLSLVQSIRPDGHTVYTANVKEFAGEIVELDFTLFAGQPHIDNASLMLDDIRFSSIPEPQLTIKTAAETLMLTWPTNFTGFTLQSTTNLISSVWTTSLPAPVVINGQNTVTNPISATHQFFRLSQ